MHDSERIKESSLNLPVVLVAVRRIESARVQGRATLRHVPVAQIRESPIDDAHAAPSQHLAVTQVTGGDVHVDVIVVTYDVMMRRRVQNGVLPGGGAARQGL